MASEPTNFSTYNQSLSTPPPPLTSEDNPFSPTGGNIGNPFSETGRLPTSSVESANPYAAPRHAGDPTNLYSNLSFLQRRAIAERKVKPPALAMLVLQVIVAVMVVFQLVVLLWDARLRDAQIWFSSASLVAATALCFFILFGSWRMYRLRGYGWAMAAAILSMLPCTGCCVIGLPVGIWALIVLNDPIVKSAFD